MIRHESQRGYFAYELYTAMETNIDIYLICIDLGYRVFDFHFSSYPNRCINTGAAEQGAMDIAVGLALAGKIPFVYSITPFLLFRPFETLRTYINHENIPVKMIGGGRNTDYHIDGFSHHATDVKPIIDNLKNIKQLWPQTKEEVTAQFVNDIAEDTSPYFVSLTR